MKEHGTLMKPEMVLATLEDRKGQTRRPVTFHNSTTGGMVKRKDWHELRWKEAWYDDGPSPAGNPGPYWHVPFRDIVVRVYPRVQPGDILWVRETWRVGVWSENAILGRGGVFYEGGGIAVDYKADNFSRKEWIELEDDLFQSLWIQSTEDARAAGRTVDEEDNYKWEPGDSPCRWRPSIHMPRLASRLDLDVLKVRSQRVQEISEEDAKAEGIQKNVSGEYHCGAPHKKLGTPRQHNTAIEAFQDLWNTINTERGFLWADNHPVWVYDFKRVSDG